MASQSDSKIETNKDNDSETEDELVMAETTDGQCRASDGEDADDQMESGSEPGKKTKRKIVILFFSKKNTKSSALSTVDLICSKKTERKCHHSLLIVLFYKLNQMKRSVDRHWKISAESLKNLNF